MRAGVAGDEALAQLRELVAAEGGELAVALVEAPAGETFGPLLAATERCRSRAREYALLVESIVEGYLVHYGHPRLIAAPDDDLRLLAGDYLYALGLSLLAALGDLQAVTQLADVIALCAQAHAGAESSAEEEPKAAIAESIWALGALGVAGGSWPQGEAAKQAIRDQRPGAAVAGLEAASRRAAELGIALEAGRALIAFSAHVSSNSTST